MAEPLADERLRAARDAAPPLTEAEIAALAAQLPDWRIVERDGERQLERTFRTPDFRSALAFATRVGDLAEAAGHHPALLVEWGRVTVRWWTHQSGGLDRNDFVMAARTDRAWADRNQADR
ncbi:MAG: 4a-hydroxytetrahydrobiopterin dehydratase [Thermomicrobiales bacterium]|nr:4a-hydroxytetrahydrobiopterin dehydratase [Thermomicrobiales bacterium]